MDQEDLKLAGFVEPLWERQPGETAAAFEAFKCYRSMSPRNRTLEEVGLKLYPPRKGGRGDRVNLAPTSVRTWSGKWRWVRRVEAWDKHRDRVALDQELEEIRLMGTRHARGAMVLFQKGLEGIEEIPAWAEERREVEEIVQEDGTRVQVIRIYQVPAMSWRDRARLVKEGAMLERLSRGQPETITEQRNKAAEHEDADLARALLANPAAFQAADQLLLALFSDVPGGAPSAPPAGDPAFRPPAPAELEAELDEEADAEEGFEL